jgi:DNA-binding IclR family transcriptional regulator
MPATHTVKTDEETDDELITRILGEFREMPDLALTPTQAARLWGLSEPTCQRIIVKLTACGLLRRMNDGRLIRAN